MFYYKRFSLKGWMSRFPIKVCCIEACKESACPIPITSKNLGHFLNSQNIKFFGMEGLLFSINFIKLKSVSLISTLALHSFRDTESIQASPTQTVGSPHASHVLRHADPFRISIKVFASNFSGPLDASPMIHSDWVLTCSIHLSSSNGSIRCHSTLQREAQAWLIKDTPSILNCKTFDFFGTKFDHSSYLKNLCKYNQI